MDSAKIKKKKRLASLLREVAGSFIRFEVDPEALVTATKVILSASTDYVRVLISVFPEKKEKEIVDLLNRKRKDLRKFLKAETRLQNLPEVSFEIDKGLKLETKIENILK
ncbi:MAG: ribosome-binding factor A [Candidatus Pacebacteria bacterium]|nr:ribosome-binding factor A [Candidatus Paceibacterota bacterium]NUQ57019.1 ribosome-binding factor A [Candidatus Paceibacter sp.]